MYRIILLFLILIWVLGNFSDYLLETFPFFSWVKIISSKAYSLVCHRESYKLFCIEESCTQLCSRCTGIYVGALLTAASTIMWGKVNTPDIKIFLAAIIFILLDIIFYNIGLYDYNQWIAITTGMFSGSVAFLYIRSGFEKLLIELE